MKSFTLSLILYFPVSLLFVFFKTEIKDLFNDKGVPGTCTKEVCARPVAGEIKSELNL